MNRSFVNNILTDFKEEPSAYHFEGCEITSDVILAKVDTLIIGGGLLGLSTALSLAEAGQDVLVTEARHIGHGPSGRSGGQLWPGYGASITEMCSRLGEKLTIKAWQLTHQALATLHRRAATRPDYCNFRPGVLLASKTISQSKRIKKKMQVYQELGFKFAQYVTTQHIKHELVNTDFFLNGIVYKGTGDDCEYGHLNPLKLTTTVARLAQASGARLVQHNPVLAIYKKDQNGYIVVTQQGDIEANNVVVAAGANFRRPEGLDRKSLPRTYLPVQTVILATQPISNELARELVPGGVSFYDSANTAMNYGRIIPVEGMEGYSRLTLGGADAAGQVFLAWDIRKIEQEMRLMFPQLDHYNVKIEHVWGGNCDLSRNGIPVLGNPTQGLYYCSSFAGQGMLNTTTYGSAIAKKILGNAQEFNLLAQISSSLYANHPLIAWFQAAKILLPQSFEDYQESFKKA